ncbi:MAG: thiosulfate oxidation carrier protein SoxY [Burkholderiales bacterium]|jgi:sulfur-oxidizing protein SoxY|nr:thiosulfate oxidation carrier protein SoxY [Burkholderiales bacterium]
MNPSRRTGLRAAGSLGLYAALAGIGLFEGRPVSAQTFNATLFQARNLTELLRMLGATSAADSKEILITTPDIAENGAVVPVAIRSQLPRTEQISLLVEKNPDPLVASYQLLEGVEPDLNMRVKMSQTSDVIALVKADGRFHLARKEVKVTIGGCGG